jgi:hypothetical protein
MDGISVVKAGTDINIFLAFRNRELQHQYPIKIESPNNRKLNATIRAARQGGTRSTKYAHFSVPST